MKRISCTVLAWVALAAAPAAAQDPPPATPAPPQIRETELVFEREVFDYPALTASNPFRPLVAADSGGPRYDQLRLSGIILSENPENSMAIFNTANISIADDGTISSELGESYPVRTGQTIGNVTVVEIHLDHVVVDVEEFGIADRKIMRPLNLLGGNQ